MAICRHLRSSADMTSPTTVSIWGKIGGVFTLLAMMNASIAHGEPRKAHFMLTSYVSGLSLVLLIFTCRALFHSDNIISLPMCYEPNPSQVIFVMAGNECHHPCKTITVADKQS